MIGLLLITASWALLRFEGKGLAALGLDATRLRAAQLVAAFLAAAAAVVLQQTALSAASGLAWRVNADFGAGDLFRGIRLNVNSVLFEELVFRGYLLYQAIRWLGMRRAVALDAGAFGVYHWFSYGVIGNPVTMAFVFLNTGAFGLMLALAFARTASLAAPVGLHLGWNTASYLLFSAGPFGRGILLPADGGPRMTAHGPMGVALDVGLPLAFVAVVIAFLVSRRRRC